MDLNFHARYILEHKILPGIFYDEGPRLLSKFMLDGGKVMGDYYGRIAQATPSYECPYDNTDFFVSFRTYIRDAENCMILRIEMPEPERPLLCRAVYLCYGTRGGYDLYATSELAADGSHCLCAWSEDGYHINFGDAHEDPDKEMDSVVDLFWQLVGCKKAG